MNSEAETFELVYDQICKTLGRFGEHDSLLGLRDYSIYGDYWGHPQVKVSVGNLELLQPHVVATLQNLISKFPGWEIVVAVANLDIGSAWPEMGLIIRAHEIIDGLQRRYFPTEFQDIRYAGSRPGTDRD